MRLIFISFLLFGCREWNHNDSISTPTRIQLIDTISHLPIVVIQSDYHIKEDKKVDGSLEIFQPGLRLSEDSLTTRLSIGIEIRGQTSAGYPKKQYSIEIRSNEGNEKASLLDMPESEDWILQGPYNDKTLMRNHFAYSRWEGMGHYAVRRQYVEAYLQYGSKKPEYVGIYILMERISKGKERVDVGDDGTIFKVDKIDPDDVLTAVGSGRRAILVYPKAKKATQETIEKWRNYVTEVKNVFSSRDMSQISQTIDVESFIDFVILREFSGDIDSYWASTYFHKEKDGLLKAGPVWDFDLGFGNHPKTEATSFLPPRLYWWKKFLEIEEVQDLVVARWRELRKGVLSDDEMRDFVDQTAEFLEDARVRNYQRWPVLGEPLWPYPKNDPDTYQAQLEFFKDWLTKRAQWFDSRYGD